MPLVPAQRVAGGSASATCGAAAGKGSALSHPQAINTAKPKDRTKARPRRVKISMVRCVLRCRC